MAADRTSCNARALVTATLLLAGCGYEGDGEFEAGGFWPLRTYVLRLPEVQLKTGNVARFDLSGYRSHGRSLLEVRIDNTQPVAYFATDIVIALQIVDDLGTTYFYRDGPLNAHYARMMADGSSSYPLETEWNCDHAYDNPEIDERVISFDPDRVPIPTPSLRCWHFLPTGTRNLSMTVTIKAVPESVSEAVADITLTSGWK